MSAEAAAAINRLAAEATWAAEQHDGLAIEQIAADEGLLLAREVEIARLRRVAYAAEQSAFKQRERAEVIRNLAELWRVWTDGQPRAQQVRRRIGEELLRVLDGTI